MKHAYSQDNKPKVNFCDKNNIDPSSASESKVKVEPAEEVPETVEYGEDYLHNNTKEGRTKNSKDLSSNDDMNVIIYYQKEFHSNSKVEQGHNYNVEFNCWENVKTEAVESCPEPVRFDKNWLSYEVKNERVGCPSDEQGDLKKSSKVSNQVLGWSLVNELKDSRPSTSGLRRPDITSEASIYGNKGSPNNSAKDVNFDQQNNNSTWYALTKKKVYKGDQTKKTCNPCEICGHTFIWASDLKRHMTIHSEKNPFQCDVCHKSFVQDSHLKRHLRIHSGEKPFQCHICHSSFTQNSNLKAHMMSHSREKSFQCDICRNSFTHHSDLRRHLRTHSGEKPYRCDICNKSFTQSSTLKRHKESIHR